MTYTEALGTKALGKSFGAFFIGIGHWLSGTVYLSNAVVEDLRTGNPRTRSSAAV
jgi:hypothetical protein